MSRLFGDVLQNGYVVRDIEAAMRHWIEVLGVGRTFAVTVELRQSTGAAALTLPSDRGDGDRVRRLIEGVVRRYGHLEILFKSAHAHGQIAACYCGPDGAAAPYPWNPNGSVDDIAAVCDPSGRIFGLMLHPEAYVHRTHHPRWTRETLPEEGLGMKVFRNALTFARTHLL